MDKKDETPEFKKDNIMTFPIWWKKNEPEMRDLGVSRFTARKIWNDAVNAVEDILTKNIKK